MTNFVTQCPHCRTSFRVNRAQLAAAHGVVRCGACMEVFNATRHLHGDDLAQNVVVDTAEPIPFAVSETPQPRPQPPTKPQAEDNTLWIHDDLDLDSLDLDEELAKLERQELELSREFLELEPQPGESLRPYDNDQPTADDEAWAEQLLSEESDQATAPTPRTVMPAEQPFPPEPDLDATELHFAPVTRERPAPPSPLASSRGPLTEHLDSQNSRERVEPAIGSIDETDDALPQTDPAADAAPDLQPSQPRRERDDPLFELDDEPLQLDWEARRRPWGRWLGWGALNLIALLALGGQYVAYNFDELARQDEYRPWLAQLCPSLGCELPPKVDISQIRSSNLVVRSHPDFAGALVVDAIIYNRAAFAQPFPLLEVRFADINQQTLASRTFKPGEYLSGELAGQREMPSQIPIHIALDILDPGAKAVNYSLSFRSPE
ncbi:zinc-ribbon domain-containing protein [Stutzerimonas sp. VN223-3]|uniref:DUF3426 domain-containing protein n=1 Tax=Stutzerimonas sp. VN223-3 TaxID=3384601 RepID=UPI0038B4F6EE